MGKGKRRDGGGGSGGGSKKAAKKAVGSLGGVSKVSLSSEEEESLLRLVASLDATLLADASELVGRAVQGGGQSSGEEDDDDDDDEEEEDSGDDEGREGGRSDARSAKTAPSRDQMIKKLIRDGRRDNAEEVRLKAADRQQKKDIFRGIFSRKEVAPSSSSSGSSSSTVFDLERAAAVTSALPACYKVPVGLSACTRLVVSCDKKPSPKVVVVERVMAVCDIAASGTVNLFHRLSSQLCALFLPTPCPSTNANPTNAARNKFHVGKKYDTLVVSATGQVLTEAALLLEVEEIACVLTTAELAGRGLGGVAEEEGEEVDAAQNAEEHRESGGSGGAKSAVVWSHFDIPDAAPENEAQSPARQDPVVSNAMLVELEQRLRSPAVSALLQARQQLPIHRSRQLLLDTIRDNQFAVVSGETGSGKTTQLPSYLLEDMINTGRGSEAFIVCTQPRRIAAISVAERVSAEWGEESGQWVGHQVRLHSRFDRERTRVLYCTTGVLLRRLQSQEFLAGVSHVVVDEVHERQVETDFLLALLRRRAKEYPALRIVAMSATLQEGLFADYFQCPIVYLQGRAFPVESHYLPEIYQLVASAQRATAVQRGKVQARPPAAERLKAQLEGTGPAALLSLRLPRFDSDAVAELVVRIIQTFGRRGQRGSGGSGAATSKGDAILVFLSGMQAIDKVSRALRQRDLASLNATVFVLHGSLPPEQQRRVFGATRPGQWKVVLSTNIAETSVTIDDVTHVIDCALVKETRYDPATNVSSLQEVAISRASARQRAGRAGRVRPGHCWKLYTQAFEDAAMDEYPPPEIRRVPLEEVVLQVLLLGLGAPETFLSSCLEPPSLEQVRASVQALLAIGAVLPQASLPLTALGFHLAKLPVDVRVGKMLIMACLLGVQEPVLTIAAALGSKPLFVTPPSRREEARQAHLRFAKEPFSDHLAVARAYDEWRAAIAAGGRAAASAFCSAHFLNGAVLAELEALRRSFKLYLHEAGFLGEPPQQADDDSSEEEPDLQPAGRAARMKTTQQTKAQEQEKPPGGREHEDKTGELVRCALVAGLTSQVVRVSRFLEREKARSRPRGASRQDQQPIRAMQVSNPDPRARSASASDPLSPLPAPCRPTARRCSCTLAASRTRSSRRCWKAITASGRTRTSSITRRCCRASCTSTTAPLCRRPRCCCSAAL